MVARTVAAATAPAAKQHLNLTIKAVSRPKDTTGFVVLPRRWVVERILIRMVHARRHARDSERLMPHSEASPRCPSPHPAGTTPEWGPRLCGVRRSPRCSVSRLARS